MTDENVSIPEVGTGTPEHRWDAFTNEEVEIIAIAFSVAEGQGCNPEDASEETKRMYREVSDAAHCRFLA